MDRLMDIVNFVYAYCTDFVINIANILGVSYYEVNTFIFVILYPLLLVGLTCLFVIQILRLRYWKKTNINVEKKDFKGNRRL